MTCLWSLVPVGASRTVTLVVAVPSRHVVGSIITNTATTRSDSFDNNPATATATATGPVTASADVSAVKSVLSGSPVAGGQVRWQILVGNAGPSDAAAVVLDDTPPAGVTFTASSTGTGTCTLPGGALHCDLGTLPAGGSVTVTIDGTLAPDFRRHRHQHRDRRVGHPGSQPGQQHRQFQLIDHHQRQPVHRKDRIGRLVHRRAGRRVDHHGRQHRPVHRPGRRSSPTPCPPASPASPPRWSAAGRRPARSPATPTAPAP